ncbi:MAG: hypothetical protein PUJ09_07905 [Eubacteriales bacterium]|nr:hypothetical protein [Eubacteriales bacterium]
MAGSNNRLKSVMSVLTLAIMLAGAFTACNQNSPAGSMASSTTTEPVSTKAPQVTTDSEEMKKMIAEVEALRYNGEYSEKTGALAGTDALGRELPLDITVDSEGERSVGLFYFLWQGQHGNSGPYDNSVIAEVSGATDSEANWLAAGGGSVGAHHFWGKPMFGYYTSDDAWVMRKHVQMLTDIGIDYLVFDATNGFHYADQALRLMAILNEYHKSGIDVPKVAFYTNSSSGKTINNIYTDIYKAHPEYKELWFCWDGKPMIVGNSRDTALSNEAKNFFRIKASQWPNAPKNSDGFPWMEFSRLLSDKAVYTVNGKKEILNVSIAQHSATCVMSATAWYGANDRTRSWHNGSNDTSPDAVLYGYNFAEQWEWALKQNVSSIFVTGWNEWVAQRQRADLNPSYPVFFVDCCDPNTSRDAEPMEGLFGDNYYMQLASYVRRYKGTAARVRIGDYATPTSAADFAGATAIYGDYRRDTVNRSSLGFGNEHYSDQTGLNDFIEARVMRDADNIYFYIQTASDIRDWDAEGRMTLFINTGSENSWNGYGYCVNRGAANDGIMTLERFVSSDENGWNWESVTELDFKVDGDTMTVTVPRHSIGLESCPDPRLDLISLRFKWADGYEPNNVFSFYKNGDAAPIGRFDYVYSNVK